MAGGANHHDFVIGVKLSSGSSSIGTLWWAFMLRSSASHTNLPDVFSPVFHSLSI